MKRLIYLTFRICFILLIILSLGCTSKKNDLAKVFKVYSETAKFKPAFIPLSPGTVTPTGWIKDWAVTAREGITGHLDEYEVVFGEAWKGPREALKQAMGAREDGTGWPLEQSAYWLDGAVRLAYILKDTALVNKVSKRLDYVVNGVLEGGESFIYWKKNAGVLFDTTSTPRSRGGNTIFNNWAHHHMGRALVAYYQATGDEKILQALVKVYRQFPVGVLGWDLRGVSGGTNIDPMVETYLMSGDKAILDSILSFSERPSIQTILEKWPNGDLIPGHGVIFYEGIRIPALLYPWTGNRTALEATRKAIEWGEKLALLPVGINSSEESLAGIGSFRNIETCNTASSEWTFLHMLRLTGDKSYADRIEKAFFNAGPGAVDREFKNTSYYQRVNRFSNELPGAEPQIPGSLGGNLTEGFEISPGFLWQPIGHEVLCCLGNLNRVIPNYIQHMWMATMDHGLAATLYGPCRVQTDAIEGVKVDIECETSYPFDEVIRMTVNPEKDVEFPLYLRVPGWCKDPEITVNGTAIDATAEGSEFIRISRRWKKNDEVTLHFPMHVEVVTGRETPYPQDIAFYEELIPSRKDTTVNQRWKTYFTGQRVLGPIRMQDSTINNPYACVYYGPLLFSLPIPDIDANNEKPGAKFNYALDLNSNDLAGQTEVIRGDMPGYWNWPLDAPLKIRVRAKEFNWTPTESQPLPKGPVKGSISTQINLVPYGCTEFRVAMFPVTEASWNSL